MKSFDLKGTQGQSEFQNLILPILSSIHFTGIGLDSMNKSSYKFLYIWNLVLWHHQTDPR